MFTLSAVAEDDFDALVAIRVAALPDSPERARERLEESFYPQHSRFICVAGETVGFYTLRPAFDGFHLEHFYVLPARQSGGIGSAVMRLLLAECGTQTVFVGVLRDSPANRFYQRHGFTPNGESERAIYYIRKEGGMSPCLEKSCLMREP